MSEAVASRKRTDAERFEGERLDDVCDGMTDLEAELIELFEQTCDENMPKLEKAFKENDKANAVLYSHDLKGSSANIGGEVVREIAGQMEALCREGKLNKASKLMDEAQSELKELMRILKTRLEKKEEDSS